MINRELVTAARREPGGLWAALLGILAGLTHLLQAWALAHGLAAIVNGAWVAVAQWSGVIAAIALLRWGVSTAAAGAAAQHGISVRRALRDKVLRIALSPSATPVRVGAARSAIVDGADGVETYVSRYLGAFAQVVVLCPVTLVMLAGVSPMAALAAGSGVLVALLGPIWWRRQAARRAGGHWDDYESFSADFAEYHRGMVTVRALGAVKKVRGRIQERSTALHRATVSTMRFSLADTALSDVAIQAATVAAAAVAAMHAISGESAPQVYLALLLAGECFRPIRELSRQWHAGYLGLSAVAGLAAFGAFGPSDDSAVTPSGLGGRRSGVGDLVLCEVSFAHGRNVIFDGASIRVGSGQLVAVTGESGAGKSTLFDLIAGVLSPDSGSIQLGENRIHSQDVAVVSQRPVFTSRSIRENLLAVAPDIGDEEMLSACAAAGFGELVEIFPKGLDESFGEDGAALSGGQRQRLAIARSILSDRYVVLVDEPTSALDEATADEVLSTLSAMATERLVMVITHDPRVQRAAATQLLVADGGVAEVQRLRR